MKPLPQNYDHKEAEKRWQSEWETNGVYQWRDDLPRAQTFVIDTPPPTVSGVLHMGHVFSYTQADFVARYQRMSGKDVFYPMGYDDNGLPTERLVEKTKKVRATDMSREEFIALCEGVSAEARQEFRKLFVSTALSVDWRQEYHTISEESRKISQLSFLDLFRKEQVYRKLQPMLWDPVDQTAIAQAEIEDKELASTFNDIKFAIAPSPQPSPQGEREATAKAGAGEGEYIVIGTTRPELIPACVAIFYHPDDERYQHLKGKHAVTPLFGVSVPILEDDTVEPEKGTGIMMCCTFGDEKDIEKWRKHNLPTRVVLNKYGKMDLSLFRHSGQTQREPESLPIDSRFRGNDEVVEALENLKAAAARTKILELLKESGDLVESKPITHAVKCAERSGAALEILPTHQWFVNVLEHKEALKAKGAECNWHPDWMRLRMDQWIDGLNWDWCISRQRYFGVPFPVWYVQKVECSDIAGVLYPVEHLGEEYALPASPEQLPVNPIKDLPANFEKIVSASEAWSKRPGEITNTLIERKISNELTGEVKFEDGILAINKADNCYYIVRSEMDVMDTWATSSISPQLSSKGISSLREGKADEAIQSKEQSGLLRFARNDDYVLDAQRHAKLYPADLRPQAHEIIRTWAFYTVVKSYLHADSIPWKNLMISGWCLAADKTKMSKSKGNVITPVELIEDKGTDAVRYWASTSRLGTDTAFSEDLLKIGRKLVTKLWNASKFAALQLDKLEGAPTTAAEDVNNGKITQALDLWILTRLHRAIAKATAEFEKFEYCDARVAAEDFFWNDFCDNYLELVKARAYGASSLRAQRSNPEQHDDWIASSPTAPRNDGQQSALYTLHHCLNGILRLFAPIVPHITEELFSHIFDGQGSIHARGMWPDASDYPCIEKAEQTGIAAVSVLNAIRKAKSEKGVSIKYPITQANVAGDFALIAPALDDLKAAGNVNEMSEGKEGEVSISSEDGRYTLHLVFASEAEVA